MIAIYFLLLLLALGMAPHPLEPPSCAGWFLSGTTRDGVLVLNPIIVNRGPDTRVDLWLHMEPGLPQGPIGWYHMGEAPVMSPFRWLPVGVQPGVHGVAAEVFAQGEYADGWEQNRNCYMEVRVR